MIAVIVIIIILILFFYRKKENYVVKTDILSNNSIKDISEEYQYPECIGCLTMDQKLKPGYKYNISDDRCVKNNVTDYTINTNDIENLINYNQVPNNFTSCYNDYNSIYSSVQGNYIILFRNDSIKMRFKHISIHERDINKDPFDAIIFSANLVKQPDGSYVYPETVLNSNSSITFETSSITITLPSLSNIGYVNIQHLNIDDANTLNGSTLVVLRDNTNDPIPSNAQVVFYTTIYGNDLNRIIYTYNHLNTLPNYVEPIMPIVNNWTVPCDNCTSMLGKLFKGHYYKNTNDIRCYRPINDTIDSSIINSEKLDPSINFISCSNTFDTRYMPANGKFIYINRVNKTSVETQINKIQVYTNFIYDTINPTTLSALVKNYKDSNSLFENTLDSNDATNLIILPDQNTKIFINLGTNKIVTGINIIGSNLVGLRIYVISVDDNSPFDNTKMKVTSQQDITDKDTKDNIIIPLSNNKNDPISNYLDILINEQLTYDINNKYLTTYKNGGIYYQIPYMIYNFPNGRSIFAKTLIDSSNILDKINLSNAVTLFNISYDNTNVDSVSQTNKSYILNPIKARYLRIISAPNTNMSGVVSSITFYNSNTDIIYNVINPPIIYTVNINNINMLSTTSGSNGNIFIDIQADTLITFIKIVITSVTIFTNSTVELISSTGTRVYSQIISSPSVINYLITDYNLLNDPNKLNSNYEYPSCLLSNICNTIAPNSYYHVTNDGRCFKSISSIDYQSCKNCMTELPLFTRNNQISSIANNFESCDPNIDTRYLPSPILNILLVGGGGGGGNITGSGRSLQIVGGYGGAAEVVEILNKIIDSGTNIKLTIGKYGHSITDYYSYRLPANSSSDIDGISGRSGQESTMTIGNEPTIIALGGGAGGCGGKPGLNGGSGGGAGSGNYVAGKSLAKQYQQDGKATGAPSFGGGSALLGTTSDTRDGRTSAFINTIAIARLYSTILTDAYGKPLDITSQFITGPYTDGNYYMAAAVGGKGDGTIGRGGGPTSNEARGGGVIIQSTTPATSHNAMATGKSGRLFYYAWSAAGNNLVYKTDPPLTGFINF